MRSVGQQFTALRRCLRTALASLALLLFAGPCSASEPQPVAELLLRAGRLMEDFVEKISGVRCTEQVHQAKLGRNGKPEYKQESVFDSLVLVRMAGDDLTVEESRQVERQSAAAPDRPLLVTNGFSTLALVFHPYYQAGFEFARLEEETVNGRRRVPVRFQHIRGTRTPAALQLRGREYPLEIFGVAWLEPDSGAITKITAALESGMEDLGLRTLHSEVDYAPVSFAGIAQAYWLPVSAVIDVESPRQHWRNVHHFSNYRRFAVTIKIDTERHP